MGLWILLILLFIFIILPLALCLLPIYIRLYKDEEGNAQFAIKVLCFPIPLEKKGEPQKEKKEKPQEEKKGENPILQQLGLSHYTSTGNLKKSISEKGLLSTLKHFVAILKPVFSAVGQIARKFRVCRAHLEVVTAGENAAMEYGTACAILYPLSAFLQNRRWVKSRGIKTEVRCDFEGFEGDISYDLILRIFVGNFIPIGLRLLIDLWKEGKAHEGK